MNALMLMMAVQALSPAPAAPASPPVSPPVEMIEASLGRFAVFADRASLERDGAWVRMRTLQVAEEGFSAGGRLYVGGWSNWLFDCPARTADRLDFASLDEDGNEGPVTPEPSPGRAVDDRPEMLALFRLACETGGEGEPALASVVEAVAAGRARLAAEE